MTIAISILNVNPIHACSCQNRQMLNLGFLASHNGSNMQAIVRASESGNLLARPCVVISNNPKSVALQFAQERGLVAKHLSSLTHKNGEELDQAILETLQENKVDLVLLVGYMKLIGPRLISEYENRILNIHPALLPKYGGKGMYGIHIHAAVIAAGEKETGITIHHANEHYDQGKIIAQCTVPVLDNDTPQTLASRVLKREQTFIVETLQGILSKRITL
jgi:phosphoribosylglycinamide formyltransferase-1